MREVHTKPLVSVLGAAAGEPALDLAVLDLGLERAVVTTVPGAVPARQPRAEANNSYGWMLYSLRLICKAAARTNS